MRAIDADALIYHLADYQLQEAPVDGRYGNADAYEAIKNCIRAIEEAPIIAVKGADLVESCFGDLSHAFYRMAGVAEDNLPDGEPDEYVDECREEYESALAEFKEAEEKIREELAKR